MMGVINLAQAEFLMVGAYTVLIVTAHGASVWIGIAVAPVVVGLLGLVIERTIIRFLYGRILDRSEEHTSELQSQSNLVCRLLLEKKKKKPHTNINETTNHRESDNSLPQISTTHRSSATVLNTARLTPLSTTRSV